MKVFRHLAGYAPVKLASLAAGFGGVYAFTRLLGPEAYGQYALMLSALALVHTISFTWAEAAAFRFAEGARLSGTGPRLVRTLIGQLLRASLLALGVIGLAALLLRDQPRYLHLLPWLAVLMPLNAIVQTALELHRAHGRVGRYARVETTRIAGGFALGVGFAFATGLGAAAPFAGLLVVAMALALSEGVWLKRLAGKATPDAETARTIRSYGLPIAFALVLDLLLSAGDRFLLAWFEGDAAVGAYAAGYGVADKTVLMLCAWNAMTMSPMLISAWENDGQAATARPATSMISLILLIGLPAATGIACLAAPLAEVMVDEALRADAQRTIPWIAFAGLLNGLLIHYWSEAFQLTRKTSERAYLMAVPTLANLCANLILIPWLGLMGAVYATVGSYLLGNIVLAAAGRRHLALPLPLDTLVRLGLATGVMALVVIALPDIGGVPELLLKAGVGALIYALCVTGLNAAGARDLLKQRFRSGPAAA